MNWTEIAVFAAMATFIGKIIWDVIAYFLKKKDRFTDQDHEEIHAIKQSIIEIRVGVQEIAGDVKSVKGWVEDIENRINSADKKVRNIEEVLRGVKTAHNKNHPDNKLDYNGLIDSK